MAQFTSQKYQDVRLVIETTSKQDSNNTGKTFRQRCIERIINELGLTKNGAQTYYNNMAAHMGIATTKERGTTVRIASARDCVGEMDVSQLRRVPSNVDVYSMVTVDSDRIAVDVRCFNDKTTCLEMCNKMNKHFVRGWQIRGARLNKVRGIGDAILDLADENYDTE